MKTQTQKLDLLTLAIEAEAAGNSALIRLVDEARAGSLLAARSLVVWGPWAARQRQVRLTLGRAA